MWLKNLFIYFLATSCFILAENGDGLIAWWTFDEPDGKTTIDAINQIQDSIQGNFKRIKGVQGKGLKFDGFTSRITREAKEAPVFAESFTFEAWIAPQAYPWNWCAIVNQEKDHQEGYFFGIDYEGRVGLFLAMNGEWHQCITENQVPFMTEWSHIVGTFSTDRGITVYINGEESANLPVQGIPTFANNTNFQIGRNLTLLPPVGLTRPHVSFPAPYSFDGIIDEVKIYNRVLKTEEIKQFYQANKSKTLPPLVWRRLPELPDRSDHFGAAYTHLKFYPEWDNLWRVSSFPDIVVIFENVNYKMVFWRGTNYNMNLVTENGKWVGDQSAEGGSGDVIGCCEHMSDKQCRYAHIRIIENNNARVVIHWRYALNDVLYRIASVDPATGWGAWADEYYTIYPDGVAVRFFTIYGVKECSITEPTVFSQPGEKPEDNVTMEAVTMANMEGQARTYSFETWPSGGEAGAPFSLPVSDANLSMVNLKSNYRPFYIYEPGTRVIPYGGGTKEVFYEYSHFHAKNHWPTCLMPTDGRRAWAPDRVTSSAITSPEPPMLLREKDSVLEGRFIMGLSNKPIEDLLPLARSWLQPPDLNRVSQGFSYEGYSRNERAYLLSKEKSKPSAVKLTVNASKESPVLNPCFVIRNWGDFEVTVTVDGKKLFSNKGFRYGLRHTLDGSDLIIWIKKESIKPMALVFKPVKR